jgi:hypothetical protein
MPQARCEEGPLCFIRGSALPQRDDAQLLLRVPQSISGLFKESFVIGLKRQSEGAFELRFEIKENALLCGICKRRLVTLIEPS